jgi:hypothetical protein
LKRQDVLKCFSLTSGAGGVEGVCFFRVPIGKVAYVHLISVKKSSGALDPIYAVWIADHEGNVVKFRYGATTSWHPFSQEHPLRMEAGDELRFRVGTGGHTITGSVWYESYNVKP